MAEEKVKEPVQEDVHPILKLLGGGCLSIINHLKTKLPKEEFEFQELMDALFEGIGNATQQTGVGLFVLSPEDQKILGMVHKIKKEHGPGVKMQLIVKPGNESGLVDAGGNAIGANAPDKPLIIKP